MQPCLAIHSAPVVHRPAQAAAAASGLRSRRRQPAHLCTPRTRLVRAAATTTALAPVKNIVKPASKQLQTAQETVLQVVSGAKGRGKSGLSAELLEAFDRAVAVLEEAGGVPAPAASPLLEGRWKLLFTTRPGTASPIQRTFTGVDSFSVFQDIWFEGGLPSRVDNVVEFQGAGYLRVEAEASTERRPLPGFTPRRGEGLPFGIMGRSSTAPPAKPDMRVDFRFDRAAFTFRALPFKVPYPVPFRLLGDEAKGWIDTTYLSPDGRFRLSRGNKGTLFVLAKDVPPKQRLLEALARGADDDTIEAAALELAASAGAASSSGLSLSSASSGAGSDAAASSSSSSPVAAPARSTAAVGKWRLLWTRQGARANPLQQALAKQVANWQIITADGQLENRVQLPLGLTVRALAGCEPDADDRTGVEISGVVLQAGALELPLPIKTDARGYVDWLYLDQDFRVTRGSKGSLFIHRRDD